MQLTHNRAAQRETCAPATVVVNDSLFPHKRIGNIIIATKRLLLLVTNSTQEQHILETYVGVKSMFVVRSYDCRCKRPLLV